MINNCINFVNKWFENTIGKASTRPILDECIVATFVFAKKYTLALFTLLENDHILPAKAIIRILAELFIKLAYCIDVENENSNDEEIINKIKRWGYHSEKERLKGLQKCLRASDEKEEQECIRKYIKEKEDFLKQFPQSIVNDRFPRTIDLFNKEIIKGINSINGHLLYIYNYLQYNNAIHLDMYSIGNIIKRGENQTFICYDTLDNKNDIAKNGLFQFFFFNLLIRKYYKQDVDTMIEEYHDIIKIS